LTVVALTFATIGCTTTEQRVAGTALAGAGTGAVIGGLVNGGRGALVGAAIGGGTGAVVGAATAPRECWARDRSGRLVAVAC
jgi:hypothetical protein